MSVPVGVLQHAVVLTWFPLHVCTGKVNNNIKMCGPVAICPLKKHYRDIHFSLAMLRVNNCAHPTSHHAANGAANTGVSLLTDSVPPRVISVDDRRGLGFWVILLLGVHQQGVRRKTIKK